MRSRVIPGSSVTIDRRVPVSRLNNVDLPTLGRPTITTDSNFSVIVCAAFNCNLRWNQTEAFGALEQSPYLDLRPTRCPQRAACPGIGTVAELSQPLLSFTSWHLKLSRTMANKPMTTMTITAQGPARNLRRIIFARSGYFLLGLLVLLPLLSAPAGQMLGESVLHPANLNPMRSQQTEEMLGRAGATKEDFSVRASDGVGLRMEGSGAKPKRRLGAAVSWRLGQSHRGPGPRRAIAAARLRRDHDGFAGPRRKRRRYGDLRLER